MFHDDLVTQLEDDDVGTFGVNIFLHARARIPMLPLGSATCEITATGGTAPEHTQNATIYPAYLKPTCQLAFRADAPEEALEMADAAFQSVVKVRNMFIGSGWYRSVKCLQSEPIDLGVDDRGQSKFSFNVLGDYNRRS